MQVSFKQSTYTVKESDGRVAITIQAARTYFYKSFYVKIRAAVNSQLKPYGIRPLLLVFITSSQLYTVLLLPTQWLCLEREP